MTVQAFGGSREATRPLVTNIDVAKFETPYQIEAFVEANVAAAFLHKSERTVKQKAREGKIPAHPFGDGPRKTWYFLISELAEFLRNQVNLPHGDQADRDRERRRTQ